MAKKKKAAAQKKPPKKKAAEPKAPAAPPAPTKSDESGPFAAINITCPVEGGETKAFTRGERLDGVPADTVERMLRLGQASAMKPK